MIQCSAQKECNFQRRIPRGTLHNDHLRGQPDADFYRLPDLEIRSGRIVTDGCRRVLDFAPQKITLDVGSTVITFYGTALRIESLNGKRLTVAGRVARIDFAPKWEVDANEAPHSGSR